MRFWRWLIGDWWVVRRCGWPHKEGYATYNQYRRTILDSGLQSRVVAQHICDQLNKEGT